MKMAYVHDDSALAYAEITREHLNQLGLFIKQAEKMDSAVYADILTGGRKLGFDTLQDALKEEQRFKHRLKKFADNQSWWEFTQLAYDLFILGIDVLLDLRRHQPT